MLRLPGDLEGGLRQKVPMCLAPSETHSAGSLASISGGQQFHAGEIKLILCDAQGEGWRLVPGLLQPLPTHLFPALILLCILPPK